MNNQDNLRAIPEHIKETIKELVESCRVCNVAIISYLEPLPDTAAGYDGVIGGFSASIPKSMVPAILFKIADEVGAKITINEIDVG